MTKVVQKCSVYIGLMGYKKIIQRNFYDGYDAGFFDFPNVGKKSPSSVPAFENLGII